MYMCNPAACRCGSPTQFRGIYLFLLNKWYFDELYDAIFVRPAHPAGACALADRRCDASSTACRTAWPRSTVDGSRQAVQDPDRLARRLCLRHADRRRPAGQHLLCPVIAMNAAGFPILSLITWLPLVGGLIIMSVRGDEATVASNARWTALWTSLIVWRCRSCSGCSFDPGRAGFQFIERRHLAAGLRRRLPDGRGRHLGAVRPALDPADADLHPGELGLDPTRVREYMIAFLILETMMVGMFCALDFMVFYMFFEGVLIPMFLIIGVWGGPRRVYAAFKFFLYTLAGRC